MKNLHILLYWINMLMLLLLFFFFFVLLLLLSRYATLASRHKSVLSNGRLCGQLVESFK